MKPIAKTHLNWCFIKLSTHVWSILHIIIILMICIPYTLSLGISFYHHLQFLIHQASAPFYKQNHKMGVDLSDINDSLFKLSDKLSNDLAKQRNLCIVKEPSFSIEEHIKCFTTCINTYKPFSCLKHANWALLLAKKKSDTGLIGYCQSLRG